MLIGAIVLGLLAVLVMRFYIGAGSSPAAPAAAAAPRSTAVVVTAVAIPAGVKLDPAQLKLVQWPVESVPPGSLTSLAAIKPGSVAGSALAPGEPVTAAKLAGVASQTAGIVGRIAPDMRAATVRVTDVTGAGGFILPGQRVDMLVTRAATQTEPPATDMLAQDIRVIGVNQDANEAKDKPEVVQSVTVEVTPAQSLKLALAQTIGTVSLVLRSPDATAAFVPTVLPRDLQDRAAGPVRPAVVRAVRTRHHRAVRRQRQAVPGTTIEVVRGAERATYRIARSE